MVILQFTYVNIRNMFLRADDEIYYIPVGSFSWECVGNKEED